VQDSFADRTRRVAGRIPGELSDGMDGGWCRSREICPSIRKTNSHPICDDRVMTRNLVESIRVM
jgi:hypothetical protein